MKPFGNVSVESSVRQPFLLEPKHTHGKNNLIPYNKDIISVQKIYQELDEEFKRKSTIIGLESWANVVNNNIYNTEGFNERELIKYVEEKIKKIKDDKKPDDEDYDGSMFGSDTDINLGLISIRNKIKSEPGYRKQVVFGKNTPVYEKDDKIYSTITAFNVNNKLWQRYVSLEFDLQILKNKLPKPKPISPPEPAGLWESAYNFFTRGTEDDPYPIGWDGRPLGKKRKSKSKKNRKNRKNRKSKRSNSGKK